VPHFRVECREANAGVAAGRQLWGCSRQGDQGVSTGRGDFDPLEPAIELSFEARFEAEHVDIERDSAVLVGHIHCDRIQPVMADREVGCSSAISKSWWD